MIVLCGTPLFKSEEFQASTNDYKIPQNVVAVCDLLPGNVHALVSNRLMPYIRLYDPSITLEFGRNALAYNGIENPTGNQILYAEAQKEEIDVPALAPLAKRKRDAHFWYFLTAVRIVTTGRLMAIKNMVILMNLPYL